MIFATDLDRTLIFSKKFVKDKNKCVCVEKSGEKEISYMCSSALLLLNSLYNSSDENRVEVVPVTTRSLEQFRRIDCTKRARYAITSNGGIILENGKPLKEWTNHIRSIGLFDFSFALNVLKECSENLSREPSIVDDVFVFTKIKPENKNDLEKFLHEKLSGTNWSFTIQGIKLYVIPYGISKESALKFLSKYLGDKDIVTSGDGKLDKEFLLLGNVRLIPENSEILKYISTEFKYDSVPAGLEGTEKLLQKVLCEHCGIRK